MPRQGKNPYKRSGSPYWQIWFLDASGRECRESTKTKHLANARRILAQRRKEVDDVRSGMIDRFAKSRGRRLEEFMRDYRAHLEAHDRAPRYVQGVLRHLRAAVTASRAATLADFNAGTVTPHLTEVRATRSAKTHREHSASLRAFGSWLVQHGLWPENPFAGLKVRKTKDGDRKFKRMGLSLDQVTILAESATVRGLQEWANTHGGRPAPHAAEIQVAGDERALLYWFAATTGMRESEIAALRWEDLSLEGEDPRAELDGRYTKNRKDAVVPLQKFIADALTDLRKTRGTAIGRPIDQRDHVFSIPRDIAEHVRRDAKHAAIIKDHRPGFRRLDFHSLRYSCVHILRDLGVPPEVVQRVLRHSDIRLTLEVYGSVEDEAVTETMRGVVPVPAVFSSLCSSPRSKAGKGEATRGKRPDDTSADSSAEAAG